MATVDSLHWVYNWFHSFLHVNVWILWSYIWSFCLHSNVWLAYIPFHYYVRTNIKRQIEHKSCLLNVLLYNSNEFKFHHLNIDYSYFHIQKSVMFMFEHIWITFECHMLSSNVLTCNILVVVYRLWKVILYIILNFFAAKWLIYWQWEKRRTTKQFRYQ